MLENLTWYKQSAFSYKAGDKLIYIDPWGIPADAPKADAIFITHAHFDHDSPEDVAKLRRDDTVVITPKDIVEKYHSQGVAPGDELTVAGFTVKVVPAYNFKDERKQFHPKENNWVGYVINVGDLVLYHSGDTDNIPEFKELAGSMDFSLVPIGGTYTMDVAEAAEAVSVLAPKQAAVPMHYGFVVGTKSDGERFKETAGVPVVLLAPVNPFEKE